MYVILLSTLGILLSTFYFLESTVYFLLISVPWIGRPGVKKSGAQATPGMWVK